MMRWLFGGLIVAVIVVPTALIALVFWAMIPVRQPASSCAIIGLEVPLRDADDEADFRAILAQNAAREGLVVDDVSKRWADLTKGRKTLYLGLWRGRAARVPEVIADNEDLMSEGPRATWLFFMRGADAAAADHARIAIGNDLRTRWPSSTFVPVGPAGSYPLRDDYHAAVGGPDSAAEGQRQWMARKGDGLGPRPLTDCEYERLHRS